MPAPWEIVIMTTLLLTGVWRNPWDTTQMRIEQRAALPQLKDATTAVGAAVAAMDRNTGKGRRSSASRQSSRGSRGPASAAF